ncbi:hypothetical protein IH574_04910, partial [Candidatus Bathyarchaeota archaeon]|nr:hypothetical protein [Candidatus Bathyarchaeota archaeon]
MAEAQGKTITALNLISFFMDPQELLKIIQRTTDLNVNRHRLLLDGWDNLVLEINNEIIFRFTRREDILKQHIK